MKLNVVLGQLCAIVYANWAGQGNVNTWGAGIYNVPRDK